MYRLISLSLLHPPGPVIRCPIKAGDERREVEMEMEVRVRERKYRTPEVDDSQIERK